jgi:hypothetical protein
VIRLVRSDLLDCPKGYKSLAQALAWVALFFNRKSCKGVGKNTFNSNITLAEVQMRPSSAPTGLIAFILMHPG